MKIPVNSDIIKSLTPCEDRLVNYLNHYNELNFDILEFLALDKITAEDKVWVLVRLMPINLVQKFAMDCASRASTYADKSIAYAPASDAAKAALTASYAASDAADTASYAAEVSAAKAASYAASYAARTASNASYAASYAALNASRAVYDAAYNASYAASYAAEVSAAYDASYAASDAAKAASLASDEERELQLKSIAQVIEGNK